MDNESEINNNYEDENLNEDNIKMLEKELDDYINDDELLYDNEEQKQIEINHNNNEDNKGT